MAADAVVIGGGVDALVAAHHLARAGHRVLMVRETAALEQHENDIGWVPPHIVRDLALERSGFRVKASRTWADIVLDDGGTLALTHDVAGTAEAIRRLSPRDAARWPEFCGRMHSLAGFLGAIYAAPPPDPLASGMRHLAALARHGLRFRGLGRQGIEDLLRLLPMSIADHLDDWFESDVLKGALGAAGVTNLCQGPRSGGTGFVFLHHHVGCPPGVFRPPRSNVRRALESLPGVEMRGESVDRIAVRNGRTTGVELVGGEVLPASVVVSSFDPHRTLIELSDPGELDPQLVRALCNIRRRGVAASMTVEAAKAPAFSNLVFAPSLDYLERAYDDVKHERVSHDPFIEAAVIAQETGGRARLNVHVQYVPHAKNAGNEAHETLVRFVCDHLSQHALNITSARTPMVVTPHDRHTRGAEPQGQPYQAELALDQALWMRPIPELSQYRTPIEGLYLCGPAMHPGGPIAGAAGANAASVIVRDLHRRTK